MLRTSASGPARAIRRSRSVVNSSNSAKLSPANRRAIVSGLCRRSNPDRWLNASIHWRIPGARWFQFHPDLEPPPDRAVEQFRMVRGSDDDHVGRQVVDLQQE